MSAFGGLTRAVSTCALLGGAAITASQSNAAVTVSKAATQNMTCVSGVCTPTSQNAVLNVTDLKNLLASGNVQVNTGSGSLAQQVEDIVVSKGFSWTSASALTLDAYRSVTFDAAVAVNGTGAVTLTTNDGGTNGLLWFGGKGRLSFLGTANGLTINGTAFTLENSIVTLANAIAANPGGAFALANNYVSQGTYSTTPLGTLLTGIVDGLGNTISNLSLYSDKRGGGAVGLFNVVKPGGAIEHLRLTNLKITETRDKNNDGIGGLVRDNEGLLFGDEVEGSIHAKQPTTIIGGLAAASGGGGQIVNSFANVRIKGHGNAGGLVAVNEGPISGSYATGSVTGGDAPVGGLVGINEASGDISNSYATGAVAGSSWLGGFVGQNGSTVETSYSTGAVTGTQGSAGGFAGTGGVYTNCYWDTDTSGTAQGTGGGNVSGVTGLTTAQLLSGLPTGFDPTIWAENTMINAGFPYLIANPPVKK
ncbi:MAG TPA: GLUG motif-containing protein [Rhizomicrobium sp.]